MLMQRPHAVHLIVIRRRMIHRVHRAPFRLKKERNIPICAAYVENRAAE